MRIWTGRWAALVALLGGMAAGCGGVRYVTQAASGQLSLLSSTRPVADVVKDEKTPPRIKALLGEISAVKAFGESHGLKATGNYVDYVQLDRPAVVWVVSACKPLEFTSKSWSFPVVGEFPYLGWFNRDEARAFARELEQEGLDVDVRGVSAYSTLGWFKDALLSTMISEGNEALGELVNTVLHESVHATLHLNSQAYFNESLASFIADRLTPVYLAAARGGSSVELEAYLSAEDSGRRRRQRMHEAYEALSALYNSTRPELEKRAEKARLLSALKADLQARRELNNATLVQYRTYGTGTEDFAALFASCGEDWPRFLGALRTLGDRSFLRPGQNELSPVLRPLIEKGCPKPAIAE